ncbi:hypothetical protein [Variovorax fucosicus]|uniref:hypothetical protein n=1 Tax=Variovorax fucosicus TaxID=3053517 RepID=UPI0025757E38|nr:hypothetical protein [Variovorax sp. J22G47]MDM0054070.1 hypothetical protein [Variovorax sp. J22G47]
MDDASKKILDSIPREPVAKSDPSVRFTNFSLQDRLSEENGSVYGNWSPSFAGACSGGFTSGIPVGAIQSLSDVGACPDGRRVIQAVHN